MKTQLVKQQVKNFPEFLEDYRVISANPHISKYGDRYVVLGVVSQYNNYTDLICSVGGYYLSLGGGQDEYHKTVEIMERLSLLLECDRTLKTTSAHLVA